MTKQRLAVTKTYREELDSDWGTLFVVAKEKLGCYVDDVFTIEVIDLDPENWITTHPVTVMLSHPNVDGYIRIPTNRYGKLGTLPCFEIVEED